MITWENHGGFEAADPKLLIAQATAIAIGRLDVISREPTQYSEGDAHIPIVWRITARFDPHERVCGTLPESLDIEGRSRPSHPDRMVEDYFWDAWEANQDYVLFLRNESVLAIEPATPQLRELLKTSIGTSGRCPSEDA
jgi:hypothetical protein